MHKTSKYKLADVLEELAQDIILIEPDPKLRGFGTIDIYAKLELVAG